MIKDLLKQVGLKPKEISVYIATNRLGPCPVSRLAMEISLPRQTIYSILQDLVESGCIQQTDQRGVKQFFADPQRLPLLLEERRKELEKQKALMEQAVPELIAQQKRTVVLPKVEYYESDAGLKTLFANILSLYQRPQTEKVFRGFGVNRLHSTAIGGFLQDFIQKRHKLGVATRLLIGNGPDDFEIADETTRRGREIKRLPISSQQAATYLVGNRIYLFSYSDNAGVMIENESMAKLFKDIFDAYWENQ